MTRRILLFNGLAILAVLCNHTTSWGITAMFWWTDRYQPVTVPNFDQIGTLPYYVLLVIRKLAVFSVPAFLFVSGFFVAYAARGSQPKLSWKIVKTRITALLIPYFIWSVVIFASDALQGITYAPLEYVVRFMSTGAAGGYYFVPLLCQFYLLSPLIVPLAGARWRQLLFASALLQLGTMSLIYPSVLWGAQVPVLDVVSDLTPNWLFPRSAFFFVLGVVSGFHLEELKQWLVRHRAKLVVATVVFGALAILEADLVFRATRRDWPGTPHTVISSLYVVAFILCFLAFEEVQIPFSKYLNRLATKTYGIYLLHDKVMEVVARIIRQLAPWMLAQQALFLPILFVFGLSVPLLFMTFVARSPARRVYRYLFG